MLGQCLGVNTTLKVNDYAFGYYLQESKYQQALLRFKFYCSVSDLAQYFIERRISSGSAQQMKGC